MAGKNALLDAIPSQDPRTRLPGEQIIAGSPATIKFLTVHLQICIDMSCCLAGWSVRWLASKFVLSVQHMLQGYELLRQCHLVALPISNRNYLCLVYCAHTAAICPSCLPSPVAVSTCTVHFIPTANCHAHALTPHIPTKHRYQGTRLDDKQAAEHASKHRYVADVQEDRCKQGTWVHVTALAPMPPHRPTW